MAQYCKGDWSKGPCRIWEPMAKRHKQVGAELQRLYSANTHFSHRHSSEGKVGGRSLSWEVYFCNCTHRVQKPDLLWPPSICFFTSFIMSISFVAQFLLHVLIIVHSFHLPCYSTNISKSFKCKSSMPSLFQGTLYVPAGFNVTSEYLLQRILSSQFSFIQFIAILLLVKRVRIWEIVQCKILLLSTSTSEVVSTQADCIKDWNCSFTGLGIFRKKVILSEFRCHFYVYWKQKLI